MCGIPLHNFRQSPTRGGAPRGHRSYCVRTTEPSDRARQSIGSLMEKTMSRLNSLMTASLVALIAVSGGANAQATPTAPHMIVVKLVAKAGAMPFGFEPAIVVAQRGDTVRFVEAASAMHDVHFTKKAPGAKLGA